MRRLNKPKRQQGYQIQLILISLARRCKVQYMSGEQQACGLKYECWNGNGYKLTNTVTATKQLNQPASKKENSEETFMQAFISQKHF